jgi:hypothetical protein
MSRISPLPGKYYVGQYKSKLKGILDNTLDSKLTLDILTSCDDNKNTQYSAQTT